METTIKGPTNGILTVYCGDTEGQYTQQCKKLQVDAVNSLYVNITAGYVDDVLSGLYLQGPANNEYVSTLDCGTLRSDYIDQCHGIAEIRSEFDICQWDIKFPQGYAEQLFPNRHGM